MKPIEHLLLEKVDRFYNVLNRSYAIGGVHRGLACGAGRRGGRGRKACGYEEGVRMRRLDTN